MRLLYVIDSLSPGGAETSLAEMAPHLTAGRVDLHILPLKPRLELADRLRSAGAVIHPAPLRPGRWNAVHSIVNAARHIRPALIHTTLFEANVTGRVAASLLRLPVSTSVVGDTYGAVRARLNGRAKLCLACSADRATARSVARFHAVSDSIAEAVTRDLLVARDRIEVIPRGRDPQRLPFQSSKVREQARIALGVSASTRLILAVGRHEPAKGLDDVIVTLPQIAAQFDDTVLFVAGKEGSVSDDLRAAADKIFLPVQFLGHRTDVPSLLAAADVLVFPSRSEGSPGTLIEALAVGCPIVASNIPGNLEILGCPSPVSTVYRVGDLDALANAVVRVLSGYAPPAEMGRRRFEEHYHISLIASRMIQFFDKVTAVGTRNSHRTLHER